MKLLIVCQYFHPEQFRINDICLELKNRGHDIEVLTGIPNYPRGVFFEGYGVNKKRIESWNGINIYRVPIVPRGGGRAIDLLINYISFVLFGWLWSWKVRKNDYDAIFVYQLSPIFMAIPGIAAARRAQAPLILYVMDLWPESLQVSGRADEGRLYKLISKITSYVYERSQKILVSSRGFVDSVVENGKPREFIHYVPQYPEEVYAPVVVSADDVVRKQIPGGFNIVFTGNIGVAQGLDVVIRAAELTRDISDLHWIFIGDGRMRKELECMVSNKGLSKNVIFLGQKDMKDIPKYLALCDAALLCLQRNPLMEITLPAKLQSYLACRMPILGSVDGDAASIIKEAGCGLVGSSGNAEDLASNAKRMYAMSSVDMDLLASNAFYFYEKNFSKNKLINDIEAHVFDIVKCES